VLETAHFRLPGASETEPRARHLYAIINLSKKYTKEEARKYLIEKYSADNSPLNWTQPSISLNNLLPVLTTFIANNPSFASNIFEEHGSSKMFGERIGRGEVLIYFIFDDVELGGAKSSTDILVNGRPMVEVKSARRVGDRYNSFMLGTDEILPSFNFVQAITKVMMGLSAESKFVMPDNPMHVSKNLLDNLRELSPDDVKIAEQVYFEQLFKTSIGSKPYLIFDQATNLPIALTKLNRKKLEIERISSGMTRVSFKP
jgi:hypothetical protein